MGKPVVFNYAEHEKLKAEYDEQVERNKELMEEIRRLRSKVSDLSIRCRIAETDLDEENKRNERTHDADSECDAPNDKPTDFCPHCGCDMRGKQDE